MKKKERKNESCDLWRATSKEKRKEKKVDKMSGKQADVTTERFLPFLSSSAWLYIFWIYNDSYKKESESLHLLTT